MSASLVPSDVNSPATVLESCSAHGESASAVTDDDFTDFQRSSNLLMFRLSYTDAATAGIHHGRHGARWDAPITLVAEKRLRSSRVCSSGFEATGRAREAALRGLVRRGRPARRSL